jgi:signal transduction histidine kinase
MRNLIANAIKFTPNAGPIKIYAEYFSSKMIKICVSDTGIGLDRRR